MPAQIIGSNRRRTDGIRVENFPGFTTLQILAEIQTVMREMICEPKQFKGRIIFMSMFYDIMWRDSKNKGI